jgi:hypothetical protein
LRFYSPETTPRNWETTLRNLEKAQLKVRELESKENEL